MRDLLIILFLFIPFAALAGERLAVESVEPRSLDDTTRVVIRLNRPVSPLISYSETTLKLTIKGHLSPLIPEVPPFSDARVKAIEVRAIQNRAIVTITLSEGVTHRVSFSDTPPSIIVTLKGGEGPIPQIEVEKRPEIHGYVRNETAYRFHKPEGLSKLRNTLYIRASGRPTEGSSYLISGWVRYDGVFDLTDNYPEGVEEDQEFEHELRETYLDLSLGDLDLRAGKQVVVWGEAVGMFFADVVNAKDLREIVLPDFEYIRVPQWGLDAGYTKGDLYAELVWLLPDFHRIGTIGSEFPPPLPLPSGRSFLLQAAKEPSKTLENSEAGLKVSYLFGGLDLGLFYLYTWDKFPSYRRRIEGSTYIFTPDHRRLNILGLTFSKDLDDKILRGEFVFQRGRYLPILDEADEDGLVKKDLLAYIIGLSVPFEGLDLNLQFMERVIFNYDSRIFRERRANPMASVWVRGSFFDGKVEPSLFFLTGLSRKDMLIRPRVDIYPGGGLSLRLGLDFMEGDEDGIFGFYDTRDRGYLEVRYDF